MMIWKLECSWIWMSNQQNVVFVVKVPNDYPYECLRRLYTNPVDGMNTVKFLEKIQPKGNLAENSIE